MTSKLMRLLLAGMALFSLLAIATAQETRIWQDVDPQQAQAQAVTLGERLIIPDKARVVRADLPLLDATLSRASLEANMPISQSNVELPLPLPDGRTMIFRLVEAPIMQAGLAARYPQMKTYRGQSVDAPAITGRLDRTPNGFHAMIATPSGTVYIDPYARGDVTTYNVYYEQDISRDVLPARYPPIEMPRDASILSAPRSLLESSGDVLLEYELALATTGEYSAFHNGGTADKVPVLAEMVTAINRVNEIYERDLALRLVLIDRTDELIFTNAATDPYTNNDGSAMLQENQATIDAIIGAGNYDIGHVFSTGGGGIALLLSVCWDGNNAQGVTGLSNPVSDPFYIDYVSHEIGHQFGATHTFNGNAGLCAFSRAADTAYEPGSGSTIMGYAGICSPQNIQFQGDAMFHSASYDQIRNFVEDTRPTYGGDCPTLIPAGNTVPVAEAGDGGVSIPLNTPFELRGSGTDADGDNLTYSWEQFDLGPAGAPNAPVGNAPLFRTFLPTTNPIRTFPQMRDIVNNTQTLGEILPFYERELNFRLIVRDNRAGSGGVAIDTISMMASASDGEFDVIAPNGGESVDTSLMVSWHVAGTAAPPFNCSAVNIALSTDGGYTYTRILEATPNDGAQTLLIPASIATGNQARARVECVLNETVTFFEISDANFAITGVAAAPGDCNADDVVDAADVAALILEIFDGDGDNSAAVGSGTYAGDPMGCDANQDSRVDAGDIACTRLLITDGGAICDAP